MVGKKVLVLFALCAAAALGVVLAQQLQGAAPAATAQPPLPTPQGQAAAPSKGDARAEVAAHIPGTRPEDVRATPVAGVFELTRGLDIAYVTGDGKYAFTGDLYDLASNSNVTETRRRDLRVKALSSIPESEMVVFAPAEPKYTVTVFTDVDCPFCRKLHSQIAEYNRLGVRVRYLFFPRSGPNTESWTKAEQVWCSTDRKDALTHAKLGEPLKARVCPNNPVARSYALGKDLAIQGTPAIVMANGEMLDGYVPPDVLVQHIKDGAGR
jgi:thiol:disulfide interchange protein DsbC